MFKRKHDKRKAFSLVEILFVVIIIGVLTAVAIPSLFSSKGKADDSNATQTLHTALTDLTASQDSSGNVPYPGDAAGKSLDTALTLADKNITYTATAAAPTGNTRSVAVTESPPDGSSPVTMATVGGKNKNNQSQYNCWYVVFDPSGTNATKFGYYLTSSNASCAATIGTGGTSQSGSFPVAN